MRVQAMFRVTAVAVAALLLAQIALDVHILRAERTLYANAQAHLRSLRLGHDLAVGMGDVAAAAARYAESGAPEHRRRFRELTAGLGGLEQLSERIRAMPYTGQQQALLADAAGHAEALLAVLRRAVAARDRGDHALASRLLDSEAYLREKSALADALERFGADLAAARSEQLEAGRPSVQRAVYARIGVTLFAVLVSMIVLTYAARRVVRPVEALARHAGKLAGGDYTARNAVAGDDELGALGATLNFTSERIGADVAERQLILDRMSLATRAARIGVWDWDLTRGTITGNDAWYEIFGVTRDQIDAVEEAWRRVHPDDVTRVRGEIDEALQGGKGFSSEFRIVWPDGSLRHLRASGHVTRNAAGKPERILGTNLDVTAQKELERAQRAAQQAAESANRAKGVFLAAMSHEIRTPMHGMLGLLELMSLTPLNAEQRRSLAVIRESGAALQRVIDDILDFSKIEAGKLEIYPETMSIAQLIGSVHDVYAGSASSKGLSLRRNVDPRIAPALRADPMRLRQILGNFVSNSIKFTPSGHVELRARLVERLEGAQRVSLSVTDTGTGISREDQSRLFQPFAQAARDFARPVSGTGLGLAICRRLADLMGGTIELQSEPGRGTTLTLTLVLPVAEAADLPLPPAAPVPMPARREVPSVAEAQDEGTLVLLADDHATNRQVLLRQLNTLGYAAEAASDGVEALDLWRSGRFALVIADCHMPELDGYELARAIRREEEQRGGRRTTVIACTANALRDNAAACFAAGMDDYVAKPVTLAELRSKLDQWLPLPDRTPLPDTAENSK